MYNLIIQKKAQKDAERIFDYIQLTLLNPKAADSFIDCLEKRYEKIKAMPHGFTTDWINGRQYKKAMVKKYVIIFRINEQAHTVHIIAIGHSKQKRHNLLKPLK